MSNGRILQIYRDGRKTVSRQSLQLPADAEANLLTLNEMARIVREDSVFPDLRNFVFREVIGIEKSDLSARINSAYQYCRDRIVYEEEGEDTETIADLWSCLYGINKDHAVGDCAIKCTFLATCLGLLGQRPHFIAYRLVQGTDYFQHVAVGLGDGEDQTVLDATPKNFQLGDELRSYSKVKFLIWQ